METLEQMIIEKAVDLVSGPGGLASFLRTRLLGARLAGPSMPLDVGHSAEIPAAIRRAVILRDQHCRWAGGCGQPASACEVHHVTHLADGGKTSVDGCALYCSTTTSPFISGAGPLLCTPTAPPAPAAPTAPRYSTAIARPPAPGSPSRPAW